MITAYPKVGPIVISEIMHNPDWPEGGWYTNDQYEYIELQNISSEPVTLYDYDKAEPWKFIDRVIRDYPHLTDDDFVKENLHEWLSP